MAELHVDHPPNGVNGSATPPTDSKPSISSEQIQHYLSQLLTITLGANQSDLESPDNLLSPNRRGDAVKQCSDFLQSPRVALYAQKLRNHPEAIDGIPETTSDSAHYTYALSTTFSVDVAAVASVAIIKSPQPIDHDIPLADQLRIINLPGLKSQNGAPNSIQQETSPFELLHSIVHSAFAPYFDAFARSSEPGSGNLGRPDSDSRTGVPGAKKKLAEFELSLLQLQQNADIPQLSLPLHPVIHAAVDDASRRQVHPSLDLISPTVLNDSTFHNNLQTMMNGWTRSIQNVTKTSREVGNGTAAQEIKFWLDMESTMEDIESQIASDGVQLTLDVLNHAKRYSATTSFTKDLGLSEATKLIKSYNVLMRDFPLSDLLAAPSLEKVREAVELVFGHLNKNLRMSSYPLARAIPFAESISRELTGRIHDLLNGRALMQMPCRDFQETLEKVQQIWQSWDNSAKEFINAARDATRRNKERFIPIKLTTHHTQTRDRLDYVGSFRTNHEQLQKTIRTVLSPRGGRNDFPSAEGSTDAAFFEEIGDVDAIEEVAEAYSALKDIDILDVSDQGTIQWEQAETIYNERTSRVESSIIARLRDRLATAKTANEMFRVFSKFNALFVRPKIRGAISEYQTQLIDTVKRDISSLHERFKQQYGHSQAHAMAQLHDLSPVSGSIIWARQIERQLNGYMKKVEDVLGTQWHLHSEGQKLSAESQDFRRKLDTTPVFKSWLQDVSRRNISISGRLFNISRNRIAGNSLELGINFDAHVITLFKEVRNLLWLGFNIPHTINNLSKEARRVYPFAVSLFESVRLFAQTIRMIATIPTIALLLNGYRDDVQKLIMKGVPLRWESFVHAYDLHARQVPATAEKLDAAYPNARAESKHVQFVKDFSSSVSTLQDKTSTLSSVNEVVQKAVSSLRTCPYRTESFQTEMTQIQSAVDRLSLENFANLKEWVAATNQHIGQILLERLEEAISVWKTAFRRVAEQGSYGEWQAQNQNAWGSGEADTQPLQSEPLVHEISMRNSLIYLNPPLEFAKSSWLARLQDWLCVICDLRMIQATRYDFNVQGSSRYDYMAKFTSLLADRADRLSDAHSVIDSYIKEISQYVGKWLQFQSLWDLQSESVYESLGDDLQQWLQTLNEIRKSRETFDTSQARRSFGLIMIDYEQVQVKINAKYDLWQNEILTKYAAKLGARINEVFHDIGNTRQELENSSLEASSTAQAVTFITAVQNAKRKVNLWEPEVGTFKQGQLTLSRQRFQFPSDWTPVERMEHEWHALNEILARKSKLVDDQTDALRAKISAEDQVINQRISDIREQWKDEKPASGAIPANEANRSLTQFESKLNKLSSDFDMMSKAKEALDLPPSREMNLTPLLEEVQDYKSVWAGLSTIWFSLDELRDVNWTSVQTRKLRQSLDGLVNMSKDMPSRMRQYAAYEYLQKTIRQLQKANPILSDLRSEAIRERHWLRIFKSFKPSARYSSVSMTLGDVWDLGLLQNEFGIRDIITQAQGEMALEEFLKQVKETWHNYSLDLVNFQGKCRLIRGWDDLFAKSSEHLNSLQAMKHSPYHKEFEDEASAWEDRLNKIYVVFDVWIDVQRQWIYLEGVFTGNADIKHLLPMESSRFQNINSEFFAVMKKVQRSPFVLDVLAISGVQKSLERLADLLQKIQKALGEYLERERVSFPRFYFVGDEDLLEIIGNGNDTSRVSRHLGKMFAGITGLATSEDNVTIHGFRSAQGEEVPLKREVSLAKTPKVNEWLAALETNMKNTLADYLSEAHSAIQEVFSSETIDESKFREYLDAYPAQIVVLAGQVWWTNSVQAILTNQSTSLSDLHQQHIRFLQLLAGLVIEDLSVLQRKKCEHLITEFVFQRDVLENLMKSEVSEPNHFLWLLQLRYVYSPDEEGTKRLIIKMADAALPYGFEYLGVPERLIRTPLTERCFLTMTQALSQKLGGSPYGPAGTGKTETVKSLGLQLGRFTLVFCCDDTFDFQAMGRIFLGICQVGAWGCFDEFNRLEERILSAVSQQVQNIQLGLRRTAVEDKPAIELIGRQVQLNPRTGIFITMNPGYAGRSNLPDNLKKLFRSVAMSKPDKELIAEVTLYSQGFNNAKPISRQVVPFFEQCLYKLTVQPHYDFGLRALKSVLISSGGLKRGQMTNSIASRSDPAAEAQIIVQSVRETIGPKLVREDINTMQEIEQQVFPGIPYVPAPLDNLRQALTQSLQQRKLVVNEDWLTKSIQLFQIQQLHHGVMMVGSSGSGKSVTWNVLLDALQRVEGVEGASYVIDPKVMSKESLYGHLDPTTREWTDGLFTSILRKIIDNLRGESSRRHWIIFDGDVDPEWVENLNSVLDDNKLLTLPNGERLVLPPNVRILFEVESLKYATLATVSRCGMVWFNDDNVTSNMIIEHYLSKMRTIPFDDIEEDTASATQGPSKTLEIQNQVAQSIELRLCENKFIQQALEKAKFLDHIMDFTEMRALGTLFGLLNQACRLVIEYDVQHPDFPLDDEQIDAFISRKSLLAIVWSLAGDCPLGIRQTFGGKVAAMTNVEVPDLSENASLIDYQVSLPDATWTQWQSHVPNVEVNTHSITQTDVVIPTLDTVRHEDILYSWLSEHKPLILCGPPGAGKTMTLFSALRKLPDMEVVGLNFSSATTPDLLLKSFEQHCEYRKTLNGVVLSPTQIGRWLVLFCDEINLPARDKYGTQRVIAFMRQLMESNGFWRTSDKQWVTLDRIQFVGACNPPTDAGRVPLGLRFLRHAPLVMVDYPGKTSLTQIYGTFNNAVMKILPALRGYAEPLTEAMVRVYAESQNRFTPKIQPHYVYSPRELTRWVRGVYEAIKPLETLDLEGLVRIWAHEALRLFQDRLIADDERQWTADTINNIAMEQFPTIDEKRALSGPILFSNWLSKHYVPVDREQLRDFVKARLRTFCEEEIDVPLILYDDALDHVLRIDRVFRQPQGHVILIGVSGSGKTTLSRFVAWMNGLKVFQIKVHGRYSSQDFDDDLRDVLRRCGCKGEKICFVMDESNVLDSAFLERMNTLLANAEVPGLFEGDEYASLITACKEGAQRQGLILDSQDELYKWFTQQIVSNLHVVFTMNPPEEGLSSKAATSPALFNRCVLNWFGDWSTQTLYQVSSELTQSLDLDRANYTAPDTLQLAYRDLPVPPSHRDVVVNAMVYVHHSLHHFNQRLQRQQNRSTYLTPRHFLDFVAQYSKLFNEKRDDLEEQQRHLNVGLEKLKETVEKVRDLRKSLGGKKKQLEEKDHEANESLAKMINDQKQAEQRKATSLEVQTALEKQEVEVSKRREVVLSDLAKAEPAVLEAQKSVSNIKKQQLTEVRSMGSPPAGVKLALEAVCTLLGHRVENWKAIQAIVRRDDFIASIVNYDNERQMTPTHRMKMRNEYLSKEEFTFERVNRASKACGPLVQWVAAQVNYSDILDRVGPLREEVTTLEDQAMQTKAEAQAIENNIRELENSIAVYKSEYASLISETQSIKNEMERVQFKVDRSLHLLDSLASERKRWEEGSKSFESQIDTIVGDVLAAAAFLAYSGFYDQQYRKLMMEDWLHHLSLAGIRYKATNPNGDYLSTADERLQWQQNTLPVDDLCTENAIILKRYNRYPLIIDPSGRIVEFLQRENQERKLTITSFLDDNFTKQIESALRFGNPILIQDAEYLDPVLDHVLNREYQRTGGRVLVQLGKQEIDFSPSFKLFLLTRNPSATFAPDVCSRTTFANFTITQSSLQTQSLNDVLKSERPDVDERRSNLIKMQGDFKIHLRRLEKRLLQALNESRGNILDDDAVVDTLETVKKEVGDITTKVAETDGVMAEVDEITQEYKVIAQCCSAIFAVLEQMRYVNHFYQFSLQYFSDIFASVLRSAKKSIAGTDYKARVAEIIKQLFAVTFKRTSATMLQRDRMTLALLLAQASPYKFDKRLFDLLLDNDLQYCDMSSDESSADSAIKSAKHQPILRQRLDALQSSDWDTIKTFEAPESSITNSQNPDAINNALHTLTLMKTIRADRLIPAAETFIHTLFGPGLFSTNSDLADLIDQASPKTPIALACSPGFDASFKVENTVSARNVRCSYIAMGSSEGVGSADAAISDAAATGSWVFVKNVHLALGWLQGLEKRLDSLKPHADFRLFLSMESTPKIPVSLLRISRVLMCEQPAGIRANIRDTLLPNSVRAQNPPVERARVYLLLSILHGVIAERLRYAPTLGWSKTWEFNDSDFEFCANVVDEWVGAVAGGRENVAPSKIPWEMLRVLVVGCYGGKVDHEGDVERLKTLVDRVLVPEAFDEGFDVVKAVQMESGDASSPSSQHHLLLPSSTTWPAFESWVRNTLPEREPPAFLGLPGNAEKLLLVEHGKAVLRDVKNVVGLLDEGEAVMVEAEAEKGDGDAATEEIEEVDEEE